MPDPFIEIREIPRFSRDLVAVELEAYERARIQGADEQIALPVRESLAGIELRSGRGDDRIPVVDRLFHALVGRHAITDLEAGIFAAIADHRPAIILAGRRMIQLIAAAGAMLQRPQFAGLRVQCRSL